ncbi:MAG: hypothetical protein ACKOA1_11210, partial [Bacteroidota bacterium]
MKPRLKPRIAQRQLVNWRKSVQTFSLIAFIGGGIISSYFNLGQSFNSSAASMKGEMIPSGSWTIPMDINSCNPAVVGFLQDIIQNSSVPVTWSITSKDHPEGKLWIDNRFITPVVASKLELWESRGVLFVRSREDTQAGQFSQLNCFPEWVLSNETRNSQSWMEFIKTAQLPEFAYKFESEPLRNAITFSPDKRWVSVSKDDWKDIVQSFME